MKKILKHRNMVLALLFLAFVVSFTSFIIFSSQPVPKMFRAEFTQIFIIAPIMLFGALIIVAITYSDVQNTLDTFETSINNLYICTKEHLESVIEAYEAHAGVFTSIHDSDCKANYVFRFFHSLPKSVKKQFKLQTLRVGVTQHAKAEVFDFLVDTNGFCYLISEDIESLESYQSFAQLLNELDLRSNDSQIGLSIPHTLTQILKQF